MPDLGTLLQIDKAVGGGASPAQPQQWNDTDLGAKLAAGQAAFEGKARLAEQPSGGDGLGKNVAAGVVEAGQDIANIATDPFGNLIGRPIATALTFAHDAMAPVFGYERFTPEARAYLLGDDTPQPGTKAVNAVGKAMGAPLPEDIKPDNEAQARTRKMVRAGLDAAALAPNAGAVAPMTAAGVAGAGVGDVAAGVVPEWAAPMAELGGNVLGGAATLGATAGARSIGSAGKTAWQAVSAPFTQAGRERLAGQRIEAAASDPAAVRAALANEPETLVPGSNPTTFQATGDLGLGSLERVAAKDNPDAFIGRAAEQNAARTQAIEGLQPTADPAAVGMAFRQQLADLNAQHERMIELNRSLAADAVDATGNPTTPAEAGSALRAGMDEAWAPRRAAADQAVAGGETAVMDALQGVGGDPGATSVQAEGARMRPALESLRKPVKEAASALYDAIDPDGTLALDVSGVGRTARQIAGEVNPRMGGQLASAEAPVLQAAANLRGIELFSDLRNLLSNIAEAQRAVKRDPALGVESQPFRRLTQLRTAAEDAMQAAVEAQAHKDAQAVAAGVMQAKDAIQGRIAGSARKGAADTVPPNGSATGLFSSDQESRGSAPVSGRVGAQDAGNGQPGLAGRNSGVAPTTAVENRPLTFDEFKRAYFARPDSKRQPVYSDPRYTSQLDSDLARVKASGDAVARQRAIEFERALANNDMKRAASLLDDLIEADHITETPLTDAMLLGPEAIEDIHGTVGQEYRSYTSNLWPADLFADAARRHENDTWSLPFQLRYMEGSLKLKNGEKHHYFAAPNSLGERMAMEQNVAGMRRHMPANDRAAVAGNGAGGVNRAPTADGLIPLEPAAEARLRAAEADRKAAYDRYQAHTQTQPGKGGKKAHAAEAERLRSELLATRNALAEAQEAAGIDAMTGKRIRSEDAIMPAYLKYMKRPDVPRPGVGEFHDVAGAFLAGAHGEEMPVVKHLGNQARTDQLREWMTKAYEAGRQADPLRAKPVSRPQASAEASLSPAIRHNGKTYTGGNTHLDVLRSMPKDVALAASENEGKTHGWITDGGKFLNRTEAADYARDNGLFPPGTPDWAKNSPELIADFLAKKAEPKAEAAAPPSKPPGKPGELEPNFDDAARKRLRTANEAYREYKETYRTGAVGDVLASGRNPNGYRLEDSVVPLRLFNGGQKAAEAADGLIRAAGSRENALAILGDYPALSMRMAAERDGALNRTAYQSWLNKHRAMLDKFPELRERFGTVEKAQAALDDLRAQRKALEAMYPIKPGWGDSDVIEQMVRPGPKGTEAAAALVKEIGDKPAAVEAIKDYLAWKLRNDAQIKQGAMAGTLDPKAYQRFMKAYDAFLSNPKMADVKARFETAAKAQATLEESVAEHAKQRAAFEKSAAKHFLGDAEPAVAIGKVLRAPDSVAQMRQLADMTRSDPVARAGLRRSVVEFIQRELQGNAEAGDTGTRQIKSDQFQTFVRKSAGVLAQIFSPDEVQNIQNIAADLQRSNRSISGTKLAGGSNTAQDLAGGVKHGGGHPSVIGLLALMESAGEALGHLTGPLGRVAGIVGVPVMNGLREAGLGKVNRLVAEAMLDPKLARALLEKVPQKPTPDTSKAISRRIIALMASTSASSSFASAERSTAN